MPRARTPSPTPSGWFLCKAPSTPSFVRRLQKQDEYHVSLGDITDDSNLVAIDSEERDEDVRGHEEEDTEEEEEI